MLECTLHVFLAEGTSHSLWKTEGIKASLREKESVPCLLQVYVASRTELWEEVL